MCRKQGHTYLYLNFHSHHTLTYKLACSPWHSAGCRLANPLGFNSFITFKAWGRWTHWNSSLWRRVDIQRYFLQKHSPSTHIWHWDKDFPVAMHGYVSIYPSCLRTYIVYISRILPTLNIRTSFNQHSTLQNSWMWVKDSTVPHENTWVIY